MATAATGFIHRNPAEPVLLRGDELSASSACATSIPVPTGQPHHLNAQDYAQDRAPGGAPGVVVPWGRLVPWIGPGDERLPFTTLESPNEWRARAGRLPAEGRDASALWAAWARDILGRSEAEVARDVDAPAFEERHGRPERSSTVRDWAARGRELYRKAGAWPWAAIPEGSRWPRKWWGDERVVDALRRWEDTSWPTPSPPSPVDVGKLSRRTVADLADVEEVVEVLERQALRRNPHRILLEVKVLEAGRTMTARTTVCARRPRLAIALRMAVREEVKRGAGHLNIEVAVSALMEDGRRGWYVSGEAWEEKQHSLAVSDH